MVVVAGVDAVRLRILAGIVGVCLLVVPVTAAAATTVPRTAEPTISLVSLNPWVRASDLVAATVRVTGAPPGSTLTPVVHRAIPTRSAFDLTMSDESLGGIEDQLGANRLNSTAATTSTFRFRVADGSEPVSGPDVLTLTRPGVYPLVFVLRGTDGAELATMVAYLVRLPQASPDGTTSREPLRVASQFRLQPRPVTNESGRLELPASSRAATTALLDGLEGTSDPVRASFGFTVSPALLDALAQNGATGAVTRLAALVDGSPLQSQPWSPVSPGSWLETPQLTPLLTSAADEGDSVLTRRLATPDPSVADIPGWGGRVSDRSIQWFTARGADAVVVSENLLAELPEGTFPRTLAAPFLLDTGDGHTVPAMQLDAGIAAHFTDSDPILGANRLIADLSVIALDLPSLARGMVVAPPPGWTPSAALLSAYATALAGAQPAGSDPLIAPTPLAQVVTATPPARAAGDTATQGPTLVRSLRRGASPAPMAALGTQVARTEDLVASLATLVPGGPARTAASTRALHRRTLLAAMPGTTPSAQTAAFATIASHVDDVATSVRLPPRQTITLTADTASLPVTFRRTANGPTLVVVHIDAPDRLHFPDGLTQAVRLDQPTTRFEIRVHSDSPGDTIVRLTVTSPDGQLVVGTTEIVVRSTAASGVGLVISFGSLLFLVAWWIRDIVRGRRRRRSHHIPPAELIDIGPDNGTDV